MLNNKLLIFFYELIDGIVRLNLTENVKWKNKEKLKCRGLDILFTWLN